MLHIYLTVKKSLLFFCVCAALLSSCKPHYVLTSISRTRLVVDSRYDARPDARAEAILAPYKQKVDSVMGPIMGEVARDMTAKRPESELTNLLPDILMEMSESYGEKPDFSVYNIGGIRASFVKGKVTYGDILDVAPFENKICFITLTGEKVLELFGQIAGNNGEGVSHGVELVISPDYKLLSARLHGKEIDPKASYRVATIDYVVQGNDHLTAFKDGTALNSPQDEKNNLRYIISDYFCQMAAQGKVVDSKTEGRIVVAGQTK